MKPEIRLTRRVFVQGSALAGAGLVMVGCASMRAKETTSKKDRPEQEEEISPAEDLMREHGVLKRVLLVYGEGIRRLETQQDLPPEAIADAAGIIRSFIEDYHEKLEEEFLFPRFRKANMQVNLVETLMAQHQAGRRVTDQTIRLATLPAIKDAEDRKQLVDLLRAFIRMYEPHEAREDTVLFPALRKIVTPHEYDALGEDFEKKEDQLFGEDGFEKVVDRVTAIEKKLGIYDLAQFTPQ